MQMSARVSALSLSLALLLFLLSGCSADTSSSTQDTATVSDNSSVGEPELTDVAKRIEEGLASAGTTVSIIGYCRGWDLLDEIDYGVPVTKSDWVVTDLSGAIYVLANGVDVLGADGQDHAQGFSVYEPDRTDRLVEVTGVVQITGDAHGYIEPSEIYLLE